MDKNHSFQEDIIIRVLLNEATPEEVRALEIWIKEDPLNLARFQEIQNTWNTLEVERSLSNQTLESDWGNITRTVQPEKKSHGKIRSIGLALLRVAAVLTIGILGYFIPDFISNTSNQQSFNIITAPNGSKTEILLPDKSKVWLNAGSTLKYPDRFEKNAREVFLDGEAFFEVTKDHQKKFLVNTSAITIKVYGTSFNVKSYKGEPTIETTLVEGKISIIENSTKGTREEKEILIKPKQQAIWYKDKTSASKEIIITSEIDTEIYTSWRDGELIIKGESFETLAIKLERRYGMKIIFSDEELKSYRFTGTIKNETIEQVLTIMKLASPIDYTIKENVVTIRKKN